MKRKGRILLFRGGGCTPFTQINDTHLHAMLASLLIQIENDWALAERARLFDPGINRTPRKTQEEIISIVQAAWLSIPHARVAEKGHKQTGPALPLQGALSQEDLFKDLLRVWEVIDPSTSPTEVGTAMRDDAVAFVQKCKEEGKWLVWADCHKLIDDQDGLGDALPEGMDAFGFDAHGEDDEQNESDGEDTDDEDGGGGGPDEEYGGGPDEPYAPDGGDDYDDGDNGSGDDGDDGPG